MDNNLNNFISRHKWRIASFLSVFLIFCLLFIIIGIAPFGDLCLLNIDLWTQYYPMTVSSLRALFSDGMFWSWEGGLGFASFAQNAYYTMSPFNLLLLPFSGEGRIAALDIIIILKFSLSALTFTLLLEYVLKKRNAYTFVFAIPYAFSSYMLSYITQTMWQDCLWLAPLIALGIMKLCDERKVSLYLFSLAAALFSNFYIGYMLCVFSVLFFAVCLFSRKREKYGIIRPAALFTVSSLFAGGITAFSLIPTALALTKTVASERTEGIVSKLYHGFREIAESFTFVSKPSLEYGAANVYCLSAALFFILLFLLCPAISKRKRALYGILSAFLFISFEYSPLDYFWHGLHFPGQLPARFSFLFIMMTLLMCAEAISSIDAIKPWRLCAAFIPSALFFFFGINGKNTVSFIITIIILCAVFAILLIYRLSRPDVQRKHILSALCFLLAFESAASGVCRFCTGASFSSAGGYSERDSSMKAVHEKYTSTETDFYRGELIPRFTFNSGQLYGFKGVSYYSSTMQGSYYKTAEALGIPIYARNVSSAYVAPTPGLDTLFGIRYLYVYDAYYRKHGLYKEVEKLGNYTVYENPYALPVSFVCSENIKEYGISNDGQSTFASQNHILSALTGNEEVIYKRLTESENALFENAKTYISDGKLFYTQTKASENSVITYRYISDGNPLFISCLFRKGTYEIYVDGKLDYSGKCGVMEDPISLGTYKKDAKITVKATVSGGGQCGFQLYSLDKNALAGVSEVLSFGGIKISKAISTEITGSVTSYGGVLFSTIPDDGGWKIYIDGKEAEKYICSGTFLCADIEKGTHEIRYVYTVPGLKTGIILSVVFITSTVILLFILRKRDKKERHQIK